MRVHTKENVAMTGELVVSQLDKTQTHHAARPVAQFPVIWIIFTAINKEEAYWSKTLSFHVQSFTDVPVDVSKFDYTGLILP